jgi:hypothetical protein
LNRLPQAFNTPEGVRYDGTPRACNAGCGEVSKPCLLYMFCATVAVVLPSGWPRLFWLRAPANVRPFEVV